MTQTRLANITMAGNANLPTTTASICPSCGHRLAIKIFDGLDLSRIDANGAMTPPILRCIACGGVSSGIRPPVRPSVTIPTPTPARNAALAAELLEQRIGDRNLTVVEVGHGDGSLLHALAKRMPAASFIGIDDRTSPHLKAPNLEFRARRFDPISQLAPLRPDVLLVRDLGACGEDPAALLHALAFAISWHGVNPLIYFGATCTDRILEDLQTTDLAHAEWHGFTTSEFRHLLQTVGLLFDTLGHTQDHQMMFAVGHISARAEWLDLARAGASFATAVRTKAVTIQAQIAALAGLRIALWGENAQSKAFLAQYWPDAWPLPKIIHALGEITDLAIDVVIAADHRHFSETDDLPPNAVKIPIMVEYRGRLIDFHRDAHPYRSRADHDDLLVIPA
jgi:hypothetical protein